LALPLRSRWLSPAGTLKSDKSRLAVLLDHFARIEDPRILHPLCEVLLLVVCGTIADCDDYDHIAAWGEAHLTSRAAPRRSRMVCLEGVG
jgi:hypothetical protein